MNCHVHDEGKKLLVPGAKCSDIAKALNEIYASHDLLKYRTFGYGHSFGVLCHYYGREGGLELREDCDTVLEPGMVISMEPMIMIPEGQKGAGGYREHDILVITEKGNRNITGFPYGPEHLIVKASSGGEEPAEEGCCQKERQQEALIAFARRQFMGRAHEGLASPARGL